MDKQTLVDRIKARLGHPVVNVEVPDSQIEMFIEIALDLIAPFVNETFFIPIPGSRVVDMTDYEIIDVVNVFETPAGTSNYAGDIDIFRVRNYGDIPDLSLAYAWRSVIESMESKAFRFINNKLYLDDYYGPLTVEVLKTPTLENLQSEKPKKWVFAYSLALTKEALGRIRAKYRVQGAPMEMDGDALLNEANEEKRNLEDELRQGEGLYFVTR